MVRAGEQAVRAIIENGIPTRGMPPTPGLTDPEMRALISYVQSLGGRASTERSAAAARGRELYGKHDCASCHIVLGQGRGIGPELTRIGASRKPDQLQRALVEPASSPPRTTGNLTKFLPVRVVTLQDEEVRGLRLNEDTFSIQLQDAAGRLHTYRKSALRQIDKQYDASVMPSYRDKLNAAEMSDLVAYLLSLGG
jgi:cytochrome c oxidase cbb3-type subunit III